MKTETHRSFRPAGIMLLLGAMLASARALGAPDATRTEAQRRHQRERAPCLSVTANQDRSTDGYS